MVDDGLNKETLSYHLNEANRLLGRLYRKVSKAHRRGVRSFPVAYLSDEVFAQALAEIYHHLTFAWNARKYPLDVSKTHDGRFAKWPRTETFLRFWPRKEQPHIYRF